MFLVFFYQLIDIPAVLVLAFWFVLQLIDGIASLGATDLTSGIAVFAHIGGFAFGAGVGALVLAWSRRQGSAGQGGPRGPAEPAAVG